ncbi:hypothetical protein Acr_20g0004340 [Actinidia rufa]|uniref:Uncharacterized protein n=1 Tax=Actinidia rufa TaxID=165716 RepID=A0A7J0GCS9_9ERIC|nr:hypothetical protein Acr_20g0004340 [Actinidia rufa]
MGNCLTLSSSTRAIKALPIDTVFKLPSPIPAWSPGGGFGSGVIDLGGLQVCQITTFTKHSAGTWVDASLLEFQKGNKPVTYSSRNGHAFYPKPGLVLQGSGGIGIRNDTAKSDKLVDTGARYSVISAEHLGDEIVEPPWLNYLRDWGPKVTYELGVEIEKVESALSGNLKTVFERLVSILPDEVLGEEGPTGPKMKKSWDGDEVV